MALFRRKVQKFSSPESFRLFTEGLRFLQMYDDEASKALPDRATLDHLLKNARQQFQDGVSLFPKDLLPRYYLGLVLSVEAQTVYARDFEERVDDENFEGLDELPPLSGATDELLQRAAKEFGETARRASGGDLRAYALYNQAQALARRDRTAISPGKEKTTWDEAEEKLLNISPDLLDKLPLSKWVVLRLPYISSLPVNWITSFAGKVGDRLESVPGVPATLASAVVETEALKLQIELSFLFIKLRAAIHDEAKTTQETKASGETSLISTIVQTVSRPLREFTLGQLGRNKRAQNAGSELKEITSSLADLLGAIEKSKIPAKLKAPLMADYWNKSAFVTWERALLADDPYLTERYIEVAQGYVDRVTDTRCTPRQMNEVRLAMARGDKQKAQETLRQILGAEAAATQQQKPVDEVETVAEMIARMAAIPDVKAIAGNLFRSYPELTTEFIRKLTVLLAGKVTPQLLNRIFERYSKYQKADKAAAEV